MTIGLLAVSAPFGAGTSILAAAATSSGCNTSSPGSTALSL
jgi:hypothetical protein